MRFVAWLAAIAVCLVGVLWARSLNSDPLALLVVVFIGFMGACVGALVGEGLRRRR